MTKRFGRKSAAKAPRHDFEVTFLRDDAEVVHHFKAIQKTDVIGLAAVLVSVNRDSETALPEMLGLIRRHMDNTDGVPSQWQPTPLPTRAEREEWPTSEGDLVRTASGDVAYEVEPEVRKFRAPDGTLHPMDDAAKFLEHSAGSSRRRWLELMADEELEIDLDQLTDVFEWLISLAAKRPTGPSA